MAGARVGLWLRLGLRRGVGRGLRFGRGRGRGLTCGMMRVEKSPIPNWPHEFSPHVRRTERRRGTAPLLVLRLVSGGGCGSGGELTFSDRLGGRPPGGSETERPRPPASLKGSGGLGGAVTVGDGVVLARWCAAATVSREGGAGEAYGVAAAGARSEGCSVRASRDCQPSRIGGVECTEARCGGGGAAVCCGWCRGTAGDPSGDGPTGVPSGDGVRDRWKSRLRSIFSDVGAGGGGEMTVGYQYLKTVTSAKSTPVTVTDNLLSAARCRCCVV